MPPRFACRKATLIFLTAIAPVAFAVQPLNPAKVEKVKLKVVDEADRFDGTRFIAASKRLDLKTSGMLVTLSLNPAIAIPKAEKPVFYARVYYRGLGWVFLTGKVEFLIDGQPFVAQGPPSEANRDISTCGELGCIVEEVTRVPLSTDVIDAIANAHAAEIRVSGNKGAIIGELTESHVAYFRELKARYNQLIATPPPEAATAFDTTIISPSNAQPEGASQPATAADANCVYCQKIKIP